VWIAKSHTYVGVSHRCHIVLYCVPFQPLLEQVRREARQQMFIHRDKKYKNNKYNIPKVDIGVRMVPKTIIIVVTNLLV